MLDVLGNRRVAGGVEVDPVEVREACHLAEIDQLVTALVGDRAEPLRKQRRLRTAVRL
jgi:hypothetical protein